MLVEAAARGERKLAAVRELGADAAVDYSEPGWTKRVLEATGGAPPDGVHGAASGEPTVVDPAEAR
ncbi:hypothetical protein GCM10027445_45110 [Amycolatopsis endophytica]|uniref:NADPH:quinone reductase-like Zn-dependent oxidoreductase n=1 Tax=Amycolatopsis endophytica TaxID=860233 RepID=A0A853B172_9PSEU|nr:hypothetical protein [Amycolatopsis endophytica]NYI88597.1 NADPH:quinone reductase-like Zn-dependent oxidoreductase [Amycolatopsis endophytica]